MPRFVEVTVQPAPNVPRKALLETSAGAAPSNCLLQDGVDEVGFDGRVARRRVRSKPWRPGWARVALVFGAPDIAGCRSDAFWRAVAAPCTNLPPSGSSMPHDLPLFSRMRHASAPQRLHGLPYSSLSMRHFNTAGPVEAADHYLIPPLGRVDLEELLGLVHAKKYFVLHAPRQTGKTSALIALRDLLNGGQAGDYHCVQVNVEVAQVARDDVERGVRATMSSIAEGALLLGDDFPDRVWPDILAREGGENALRGLLTRWCLAAPKPVVLLIDEIDALVGDTLLSVLRQLRGGYERRPKAFPHSVLLCGVRNIRDYRVRSGTSEVVTGGSPFNIAAKSLRLGDFTETETKSLMKQHTEETGQRFSPAALDAVWAHTQGQPWLVNALCDLACFHDRAKRDRSLAIEEDDVFAAREKLILERRTHLDQLAHKLEEDRVRRVVEPILSGREAQHDASDLQYARDLGLVALDAPLRMANPIYAEVVPRELGFALQESLDENPAWYVDDDGRLDMAKLLSAFAVFYGEHAGHWLGRFDYPEAAPQLILQAYLQRIVNGGGRIEREYGLGRQRTDLLVMWPREAGQLSDLWDRFVIECKVLRDTDRKALDSVVRAGVTQTLEYMAKCGASDGHLIVFDRRTAESAKDEARGQPQSVGDVAVWVL